MQTRPSTPLGEHTLFTVPQVEPWTGFTEIINPLDSQPPGTKTALETCAASPHIYADPSALVGAVENLVGATSDTSVLDTGSIFTLYGKDGAPLVCGYHFSGPDCLQHREKDPNESSDKCSDGFSNEFPDEPLSECPIELPTEFSGALRDLVVSMVLNGVTYGYVVSFTQLQILQLCPGSSSLAVQVSPPVEPGVRLAAVLGIISQSTVPAKPFVLTLTPFCRAYGSEPQPVLVPCTGRDAYRLFFESTPTRDHPRCHQSALLYSDTVKNAHVDAKYVHCSDLDAADELANEANVLHYLGIRQCQYTPVLLIYAEIFKCVRILCVRPPGVTVTPHHLPEAIGGIRKAVCGLHRLGVSLGRIELDAFSIIDGDKVVFTSLSLARVHNRISPAMQQQELAVVEYICQEAMRGRRSTVQDD